MIARLPYRSFRHLLSLHASATPDAPFLAFLGADGRQLSQTYATCNGRIHQIAAHLVDDHGLRPGDRLTVARADGADVALLACAAWLIGAVVDQRADSTVPAPTLDPAALADKPNTFIGQRATDAVPLTAPALIGGPDERVLSMGDLLLAAGALAGAQAITGRQRLLLAGPFARPADLVFGLLAPLIVGGSALWCPALPSDWVWRVLARADIHVACFDGAQIAALTALADNRHTQDDSPWGRGVGRHELRRLRQVCVDGETVTAEAVSAFEDRFGVRLLAAYHAPGTPGWTTCAPIDLSWDEQRRWRRDGDAVGVGCALDPDGDTAWANAPRLRAVASHGRRFYFIIPPADR